MTNPRALQPSDPPWLRAAFSKLGLSEIAGPKHERQVLEMYAAAGHPEISDDETAWCAAFVGWCLKQAGLPNSGSLMARSYVNYGVRAITNPVPRGAILVWPRGAPPSGHVNFCLHDDGTYLTCIGGNQGNNRGGGVTVSRERKSHLIAARFPKWGGQPVALVQDDEAPAPAPAEDEALPSIIPEEALPQKIWKLLKSKTQYAASGSLGTAVLAYLTDWKIWAVIVIGLLVAYIIYERSKKP